MSTRYHDIGFDFSATHFRTPLDFPVSYHYFLLHSLTNRAFAHHPPICAGPADEATIADAPVREVDSDSLLRAARARCLRDDLTSPSNFLLLAFGRGRSSCAAGTAKILKTLDGLLSVLGILPNFFLSKTTRPAILRPSSQLAEGPTGRGKSKDGMFCGFFPCINLAFKKREVEHPRLAATFRTSLTFHPNNSQRKYSYMASESFWSPRSVFKNIGTDRHPTFINRITGYEHAPDQTFLW